MYYNTLKDTLKARDRCAMLTLNARLIEQVEALQSELLQRGAAAGLDGELVVDNITGCLQVTLDYAYRLRTALADSTKEK